MGTEKTFWKNWKKITKLEKAAIRSLKIGKKIILENIPRDQIIAIYVYGSFVRRDMNKKSDVDTKTIVRKSYYLKKLNQLQKKYRDEYCPKIEFSGYSLWELKTNKRIKSGRLRPNPSKFLKKLDHCRLIYGKPLDIKEFIIKSDKQDLLGMIWAFNSLFFLGYQQKKFGFQDLLKQVFWTIELELKIQGKKPPLSLKSMSKLCPKNHIIHEALKLRKTRTKDKKIRAAFIKRLKTYIKKLEKEYK